MILQSSYKYVTLRRTLYLRKQGIGSHFTSLRLVVENRLEERPKLINKFDAQLQKDITALNEEISEIHDEIMVRSDQTYLSQSLFYHYLFYRFYSNLGYWIMKATLTPV